MNEKQKKEFLNKIALDAYNEYLEAKEKRIVSFETSIEKNQGFLYVKRNEKGYGIRISHMEPHTSETICKIKDIVQPFIDEMKEETYILINTCNKELIEYFNKLGFNLVCPSFNMELKRENWVEEKVEVELVPYDTSHSKAYITLLGEAFVPVRRQLSLKPYNWYENNLESSVEWFKESTEKGYLFGYWVKKELVGVLEVIGNDLETIAVRSSDQGKGYGSLLLRKAIEMVFDQTNHQSMTLGVLDGNAQASKLYEKYGFRTIAKQTILLRKIEKST